VAFAYYARLSRAQQAIYRKSDAIAEIRLPRPETLRPRVAALESALASEDRPATRRASAELIGGLCEAMGLPPVRVEVLAARPSARWGELHGLYTNERGTPITIQLWMRTAKQKRVVAFRTYLRTLLHEVGHHVDYTGLRLADSFHTEGFYKRESSLFHQLVSDAAIDATRDGFVTLQAVAARSPYSLYAQIFNLPELNNPVLDDPVGRAELADWLYLIFEEACAEWDARELFLEVVQNRQLAGFVQGAKELLECPHLEARGYWQDVDHPATGTYRFPGEFARLSETPFSIRRRSPLLGEHTVEVLEEIGIDAAERQCLREQGVI